MTRNRGQVKVGSEDRMIARRAPGQRRRRTRREDELAHLETVDPAKHAELLELRRYNPQAFRKELMKLVRAGTIPRGRGFEVDEGSLDLLDGGPKQVTSAIRGALDDGTVGFRALAGLLEVERAGAARASVISWLEERYAELLAAQNRAAR